SALSDRARANRVHVVSGFGIGEVPSTKQAIAALKSVSLSQALFGDVKHILVVHERSDELTVKSLRNVESVHLLAADQLNTYDVLISDDVVFTEGALAAYIAGPTKSAE